ncbi:protein unc-13 homolog C-like [Galleria mellonella]|uniref:Protein unc-13 homolog C-like n=1 Tax=Galleria mellonella TaxID=7137 RepID=A0ABM3MLZ5_GALME|nr:protein unc-13 homolog C-like [Galleria mellonella]
MDLYNKLSSNMEELSHTFQSRMTQYEENLKSFSQPDGSTQSVQSALSKDYSDFKKLMWSTLKTIKEQMELLYLGLDRHEMASRRKVLLFHGVQDPKDNVKSAVLKVISEQLKLADISSDDLVTCHHLGSDTGRKRPLLVRFQQYKHRDLVWKAKTLLKGTGLTISEFLTKPRHDVFNAARARFGVKSSWTSEGKIILLLPDKSRHKIETMSELNFLLKKFPSHVPERGSREKQLDNVSDSTPTKNIKAGRSRRGNK